MPEKGKPDLMRNPYFSGYGRTRSAFDGVDCMPDLLYDQILARPQPANFFLKHRIQTWIPSPYGFGFDPPSELKAEIRDPKISSSQSQGYRPPTARKLVIDWASLSE